MGKKAKTSRKGKKAWRANISTEDIHDFFEKSTKDSLTGGSLSDLPTDSLFFVDKSNDFAVRRKIEKNREKVFWTESVLQKNPFVKAVPSSKSKNKSKTALKKVSDATNDAQEAPKGDHDSGLADIWEDEDTPSGQCNINARKTSKPSVIPAVEVDPPGCSFNPSFEAHQDSLAQAVAEEMQKVYKEELGPQPVPVLVTGKEIDEEDMYFLEADDGSDADGNFSCNEDNALEKSSSKTKRVTRVELNRRSRLKEQQRKEESAKKKEGLLKDIDSLQDIVQEIEKEEEEKEKKRIRRITAKQERLKTRPPRLGKHKFEPAPSQVLLSEEITGSLRNLKGCYTLTRDRFKSLEKRGLIPPITKRRRK